jgi:hypothetical protein
MAVRTATGGKVDVAPDVAGVAGTYVNIPEVRKWEIKPTVEAKEYASSSTAGAKQRLPGVADFALTIDTYTDASATLESLGIKPGEILWFKLYEDATTFWIAPSYVDDTTNTVDIEGGEIISSNVSASSNGNIVYP